ncbi:MAG: diol dehydratase reactivase subunit alpha [Cellulosilyticaceae bacterium]
MRVAGIDIGNSTTEVCLARLTPAGEVRFEGSVLVETTGTKGTLQNIQGIEAALQKVTQHLGIPLMGIDLILLNEAAPVIGDMAMETITQTIITESTMIGHNPNTPSGEGLGSGITIRLEDVDKMVTQQSYIVLVGSHIGYQEAAHKINQKLDQIVGAIVQSDEAVLIQNRIQKVIPIVDEVRYIERVPLGMPALVEVACEGSAIQTLCNPYGIANSFGLTPGETKRIIPIAKSLIGNRSAVVVRSPKGEVKEKEIPAGSLKIIFQDGTWHEVAIDQGSHAIMAALETPKAIRDIEGTDRSNIGHMITKMKAAIRAVSQRNDVQIKDALAVDVLVPMNVMGALAGEVSMERAVALAAMVKADALPMEALADALHQCMGIPVEVAGVEGVMAVLGAFTTRGTTFPLAILDLGGGSTDAALLESDGSVCVTHLGGAGNFITMLINTELGLENLSLAEDIKKYPLAKVESLFHIRLETGAVKFFAQPLPPKVFGKVVICKDKELLPIESRHSLEKIVCVRRDAKQKVFLQNAIRALREVSKDGSLAQIPNVVLVGGSALDFEIPGMILEALAPHGIVVGKGEIRGTEGPRNAVATGLVLSKVGKI